MRLGLSAKARPSESVEIVLRVVMCRAAKREIWLRVYAAGFADGRVSSEGRDWVERV